MAVVLYHGDKFLFPQGFLGVDVFFVISGFVVTPLILRIFDFTGTDTSVVSNLKTFYMDRFYRLAPALIVMLVLSTVLIFIIGPIDIHYRFSMQGIATLLLAGNIGAYLFKGDYFSPLMNPLSHTWSLAVEEQTYIFLPALLLVFLRKRKQQKVTLVIFILVGVISFLSFLFSDFTGSIYEFIGINSPQQFSFYSPIDRVWQFSVGGILFMVNKNSITINKSKIFSVFFLLILIICLMGGFKLNSKLGVICVTILTLLVIKLKSLDCMPDVVNRFLTFFGNRSYSIYLLHFPIIYLAQYSPVFEISNFENRRLQSLFAIVLTIILANFSYSKIENRFRKTSQGMRFKTISNKQGIVSFIIVLFLLSGNAIGGYKEVFRDSKSPISSEISPQDWDTNCKFHQPSLPQRSFPCLYRTINSQKNYLLIGDSHAGHLSKTIIDIAKENSANVFIFTHSACPFILTPKVLEENIKFPLFTKSCLDHNNHIINFLKENDIDTVLYTQRSVVPYIAPITINNLNKINSIVHLSLIQLQYLTNKLIFIGITPEYSAVNTVLFKFLGHKGVYLDIPRMDNEIWKKKLVFSNIKYVDIYSRFCTPSNICTNRIGQNWLFEDHDHLSQAGGALIKPNIREILLDD